MFFNHLKKNKLLTFKENSSIALMDFIKDISNFCLPGIS